MLVSDRAEMSRLLEERMTRTYTKLSERKRLEADTSLIKTYLLETHLPTGAEREQILSLAQEVFTSRALGKRTEINVVPSDDPSLVNVIATHSGEEVALYVDSANPRYWMVHSTGSSGATDYLMDRFVRSGPELDRAWIPMQLLERAARLGPFRGLALDFDRRPLRDIDFEAPNAPTAFLKMQLWGSKASDVLRLLREEGAFPSDTALAKVKVKYWGNRQDEGAFSVDELKYDGKVTARGTSFDSHITLISHIYRLYADQIQRIEEMFSLRVVDEDGFQHLEGSPITFVFGRQITNLQRFCRSVFSSAEPFRLWGVPIPVSKGMYRVRAVDLHVGHAINFEISPEWLRVYLPPGACGNSVIRLYTNLQHHFDSLVTAEGDDGRDVFQL